MLPLNILLAAALVGAAAPLLVWSIAPSASRKDVRRNLGRGIAAVVETQAPSPTLQRIGQRFVLPANLAKIKQLHALAGRPATWPLQRVLIAKPLFSVVAALLGLMLLSAHPNGVLLALSLIVVVTAYFVPDLLLYSRGIERQEKIGLELPDTLDQMLIAVEAGLGFEAAMSRAGDNGKGPLAEELVRTLQDMRIGLSRREAYQALGERTNVPTLRAFIRAVVQADTYGISISGVLRTQAKEMRLKRRQRAEEKAMQIPVKVLFPLMLFILPVLFIAVLGPTVITVIQDFTH